MKFEIPHPLKVEHEELHDRLRAATREPGDLGGTAKALAQLLHPHLIKEEEFALPPLALLRDLAQGKVTPAMKDALALTDKLKAQLPTMLEEHKTITAALRNFSAAAKATGRTEYVELAGALLLHTQAEEEVSYPAAILIGEYIKEKLRGS